MPVGPAFPRGKPAGGGLHAAAVEPVAVDDGAITGKTENPWPRIAGLWLRRDRAKLDMTGSKPQCPIGTAGILVEAGGKPSGSGMSSRQA